MTPTLTPLSAEIGPLIVYFGAINQSGCSYCSSSDCICSSVPTPTPEFDSQDRRRFRFARNLPFLIVIEARPGSSGAAVGTVVLPANPSTPPHLQVLVDQPLGNGDSVVDCRSSSEARDWGGVPATSALTFDGSQATIDAATDLSCRFEVSATDGPCTLDQFGEYSLLNPNPKDTTVKQFCHSLLISDLFPVGDTVIAARVLDTGGNPGPVAEIVVRVLP